MNNVWCTGIRDWRHLSERIKQHSFSSGHVEACAVYERWKKIDTLDKEHENKIRKEASFWKMVLQRLFDILLTLSKNSLAFRGHRVN
ncbi:zinc finger MYM-type protein 1 [Trichonephila clavipes]|nr:zinc finger MYM-type protein 1 [Trichonephila clavipes]